MFPQKNVRSKSAFFDLRESRQRKKVMPKNVKNQFLDLIITLISTDLQTFFRLLKKVKKIAIFKKIIEQERFVSITSEKGY